MKIGRSKLAWLVAGVLAIATFVTACGMFGAAADKFDQAFNGFKATLSTYNQVGQQIDEIHGESFRVTRDEEFDTKKSDGTSNNDSQVLLISLGSSHIQHVGSTMILVQDGLRDVTANLPAELRFNNSQPGTPWLNDIHHRWSQAWGGNAKTIMIRSQDGTPIKVFAGNQVQVLSTEVPKSTWFRVDGKTLFVYRADYTIVDTNLLPR